MTYTEKFTWGNKELIVKRESSPVSVVSAESQKVKLEKIDVTDPRLRPTNFDKPEGTVLPILQAEGVRIDLSKRSKGDMTFWHRNMECDELIFCYQGGIRWETELGNVTLKPGELFIIPKGIAHRSMLPENSEGENIIIELKVRSEISRLI